MSHFERFRVLEWCEHRREIAQAAQDWHNAQATTSPVDYVSKWDDLISRVDSGDKFGVLGVLSFHRFRHGFVDIMRAAATDDRGVVADDGRMLRRGDVVIGARDD